MAVLIAENVRNNLTANERNRLEAFEDAPGYGGQRIKVKVGTNVETLAHVTYGGGPGHITVFYKREGEDYKIYGVGAHSGRSGGKTTYSALWDDRGSQRVTVTVQGTL